MDWLSSIVDQVLVFFQSIWDFVAVGVYVFVKDLFVVWTKAAIYAYFTGMMFAMDVAYTASREIIESFGVSNIIRNGFSGLPADVQGGLNYFGVPQAINIIFSGLSTRFCMQFVPGIGR